MQNEAKMPEEKRVEGFAVIPRWVLLDGTLSAQAKMLYLVLSSHVNREGVCWPSQRTMAEEGSMAVSTVKMALLELRERGLVEWSGRATKQGGQTSNLYRLQTSRPGELAELAKALEDEPPDTLSREVAAPQPPDGYPPAATHRRTRVIERESENVPRSRAASVRRSRSTPRRPSDFPDESEHLDGW
jgi:DNA-binding transcriptional MocR family regulator